MLKNPGFNKPGFFLFNPVQDLHFNLRSWTAHNRRFTLICSKQMMVFFWKFFGGNY